MNQFKLLPSDEIWGPFVFLQLGMVGCVWRKILRKTKMLHHYYPLKLYAAFLKLCVYRLPFGVEG